MPSVLFKGQTQLKVCSCFEVSYKKWTVPQVSKPMRNKLPSHEKYPNYDVPLIEHWVFFL